MEFFENMQGLLGNIYKQRKSAEAIAVQRIAEAEQENHNFPLTDNARQAVNNQTMYSYLKEVNKILNDVPDGYFAKQVFSGDDR